MSAMWISALAETAVRSTALLGIAALLTLVLCRRSAAIRHLVWGLALGGRLVLPLAGAVLPGVSVPVPRAVADALPESWVATGDGLHARENPLAAPAVAEPRSGSSFAVSGRATTEPAVSNVAAAAATIARGPVLLVLWAVGAAALAAWVLAGVRNTRRFAADATAVSSPEWLDPLRDVVAQLGIRRPVRLLQSDRAVTPMTWGWLRPVVVVPAASGWSPERRAVVLRHELAHVSRGDVVTQLLARGVCALYWFNPAVWFAAYRLREERERACDDEVLRLGTRASDYANHLLDIARECHAPGRRASAAVAMARRSQLEGRMRAMLDPRVRRSASRSSVVLATAFLTGAVLAASAVTPTTQRRGPAPAPDAAGEQEPRTETDVPVAVPQPAPAPTPKARPRVQKPSAATANTESEPASRLATMHSERRPEAQRAVEQGEEAAHAAGRAQQGRDQDEPRPDEPEIRRLTADHLAVVVDTPFIVRGDGLTVTLGPSVSVSGTALAVAVGSRERDTISADGGQGGRSPGGRGRMDPTTARSARGRRTRTSGYRGVV